jgi:hypothetical protein
VADFLKMLSELLHALIPPGRFSRDGSLKSQGLLERQRQTWRWGVASMLCLLGAGLAVHVLFSAGEFPEVFEGYARGNSVQTLRRDVEQGNARIDDNIKGLSGQLDFIRLQLIEQSIRSKVETRCMTKDKDFAMELTGEIDTLENTYYDITRKDGGAGEGYRQPSCAEILPSPQS